jgi:hypothetical protein
MKRFLLATAAVLMPSVALAVPAFSITDAQVSESGGSVTLTVTKNQRAASYSKVRVYTVSAPGTATPGLITRRST